MNQPLTFVHLSDLHIRELDLRSGYNLDGNLRVELKRDLIKITAETGPPRGILLGGDTAFGGKEVEFNAAVEWLHDLSEALGRAPNDSIWVVPGNHDVDRSVVNASDMIHSFQSRVRALPRPVQTHQLDSLLMKSLVLDPHGSILLSQMEAYGEFALRFNCPTTREKLFWEQDFPLESGWTLRVRGVNSAIISGPDDDQERNRLALGSAQAEPAREHGVARLLLCHHPPDWLLGADDLEDTFNALYQVQLFGHKHRFRAGQIEGTVRIGAGALHPPRDEPAWEPRYNLLQLRVVERDGGPTLAVRVWPRRWEPAGKQFVADGSVWERFVPLEPPQKPLSAPSITGSPAGHEVEHTVSESDGAAGEPAEVPMPSIRELAYDFYDLSFEGRLRVMLDLGQLLEEERHLTESERDSRIFARIVDDGLLERFKQAIEKQQQV